ncbi:MAG: type I-E CRISPR-associated protein Cas7/Cse4/CasC [Proteobacteria bacterium]|nr:MAG: type I-E CRISPR-associated protein Cas7/Cse4/CasC [Pseudomonadota bacterium]PIE40212.1 MAG: type I-E CRISPR-associated protein Cas7/Cse4/CasC [Gammaproteobacteria bacterium]
MSKNFINFHVLISHSPSCLNRDDMNMQKSAIFGGKRRVRISSQSLKRTMRTSHYYQSFFPEKSIRTRQLNILKDELVRILDEDPYCDVEEKWIEKSIEVFSGRKIEDEDNVSSDEDIEDSVENKRVAVAPWSVSEFKFICGEVKKVYQSDLTEKEVDSLNKAIEKEKKRKATKNKPRLSDEDVRDVFLMNKVRKHLEANSEAFLKACGQATDIALSGRMATSGLMTSIDGALAVAQAITTHSVDADIDWFTAVDDLQEWGSGHLDTQEFSSGVFYRYASLNIAQLQKNLGGAPREKALDIAAHVLHMLATEVPSAKQQSFAAHNLADQAMVSFSDLPVSLANAFEAPVKPDRNGGFRDPSAKALNEYWDKVHRGHGLNECCAEFSLEPIEFPTGVLKKDTLPELEDWVRKDGPNDSNDE